MRRRGGLDVEAVGSHRGSPKGTRKSMVGLDVEAEWERTEEVQKE